MLYWKKDKIQGIDNLEKRERKVITFPMAAVFMAMMIGILTGLGSGYCIWGREPENTIDLKAVEMPDWVQQDFLRKNIFSRPFLGFCRSRGGNFGKPKPAQIP